MQATHGPGALRERHAPQSRSPLLECIPIGTPKSLEVLQCLPAILAVPASHRKSRVPISEKLEASRASIGGQSTHTIGTEEAPASFCKVTMCKSLLALEFLRHRIADFLCPVGLGQYWRKL